MKSNKKLQALPVILVCLFLLLPITIVLAVAEEEDLELGPALGPTEVFHEPEEEPLALEEEPTEASNEPVVEIPVSEPSLTLPVIEAVSDDLQEPTESFDGSQAYLLERSVESRNINAQFSNGQINLGGAPDLRNTRDWWTHLYHYNTRLFFLTYVKEKMPPIGYEVGDESRLVVPWHLFLTDSDYFNQNMLRPILRYRASEISARLVVPNPQQNVWTGNLGAYTSAVATAGYRERYLNFRFGAPETFYTEDGVFSLSVRRMDNNATLTDIEMVIRRLQATPSNQEHFRNFRIGYWARFVALNWTSGSGWNRVSHREDELTGSFSPDVEFEKIAPELAISKIKDGVLEVHDSFNENPLDYVRIDKKMNQGRQTTRFITRPNMAQLGRQTVTVEVADVYGGFRNVQRINVVFDIQNTLRAEGVPQVWNVGADVSHLNSDSLIRNIRRKGVQLNSRDYETQLIRSTPLIHVGEEEWRVRLTYQGHSNTAVEIPVRVTLRWGDSIRLLSNNFQTAMAVTLHKDTQNNLVLTGVKGLPSPGLNQIHSGFSDKYFHVGLYRMNQGDQKYETLNQLTYFEKSGNESIQTAYQSLHSQPVAIGDLVSIYHREVLSINRMVMLYTNSVESLPYASRQHSQGVSYYEVTATGFKPRYFNQLKTQRHNVPIFTESSLLEQDITRFFEPHSGLNQGNYQFITQPVTNVSGIQAGNVAVSEMLEGGRRIIYPYHVELLVGQGSLVATVPSNMNFFDYRITSNPQIIQRREANWSIKVNDRRGDNQQPLWRIISKVERNSDGLSGYYMYRQGNTVTPLDQGVEVYRSGNESRSGPITTDINWSRNQGIQLMIPGNPPLQGNRNYQDRIEWSLIQGP